MSPAGVQQELRLRGGSRRPAVSQSQVDELLFHLARATSWVPAAVLCQYMDLPSTENSNRLVRALARAAGPQVVGGNCGYKLSRDVTTEEWDALDGRLGASIREMIRLRAGYRKERNRVSGQEKWEPAPVYVHYDL